MAEERSLYSHFRPFLSRFLLALSFLVMVAVFTAVLALIIQPVIDELFIQGGGQVAGRGQFVRTAIMRLLGIEQKQLVLVLPQLLFATFLGQAVFTFLSLYMMKTLGLKVVRNIRDQLYRSLVYQSVDFLSKARTGDLVSRVSNDIEKIKLAVAETLSVYIRESLTLVCLLAVIFYQDWGMATLSLVLIPVAAVPLVTVIALSYAGLLEGSVLTETVFSWPGIGLYITNSLQNADMNAVLGGTIVIGSVFITINMLSDLLYRLLDPRTRAR